MCLHTAHSTEYTPRFLHSRCEATPHNNPSLGNKANINIGTQTSSFSLFEGLGINAMSSHIHFFLKFFLNVAASPCESNVLFVASQQQRDLVAVHCPLREKVKSHLWHTPNLLREVDTVNDQYDSTGGNKSKLITTKSTWLYPTLPHSTMAPPSIVLVS